MAGITKTIGGDRLGAGKKMQAHLHHYFRSTHNLSEKFASSMGSGMLIPCLCKPAMRGDTFEIGINADARTIPTLGPLFGSFKLQLDIFQCPIRLYQALLHNNPQAIGLNMQQIKFPIIGLAQSSKKQKDYKFSNTCLLKYLGFSGLGSTNERKDNGVNNKRAINAIPALAYYDIYKNYYANKQEEKGYVISPNIGAGKNAYAGGQYLPLRGRGINLGGNLHENNIRVENGGNFYIDFYTDIVGTEGLTLAQKAAVFMEHTMLEITTISLQALVNVGDLSYDGVEYWTIPSREEPSGFTTYNEIARIKFTVTNALNFNSHFQYDEYWYFRCTLYAALPESEIIPQEFPLSVIDDMRYDILSHHTLGTALNIATTDSGSHYPYRALYDTMIMDEENNTKLLNTQPLNGICLKTYQNDIYNNWLNSDWIEGENGISELTKVTVTDGKFSMDALNFAEKLYNMLNRVVIAGNTYEDWQDVVYEQVKRKQVESPIYCGGLSQEVVFDEIVQSAPADGDPLGTLGGRGRLAEKRKGGKLFIKCDEACFIIGIISLTPRIYQTQGNEFYMTDLLSLDDFHKPAMDGIGYQDLIGERLAWFDTQFDEYGNVTHRSKIGKIPAWMEYMTSVDKAYGDFAETDGKGYMILNRNYEQDEETKLIKDATTYIDPKKYNYVFAYNELEAQNFWVQVNFDIKARRLMSARLIPNV